MSTRARFLGAGSVVAFVLSLSAQAVAQPGPPPPPRQPPPPPPHGGGGGMYAQPAPMTPDGFFLRQGFTAGIGLGAGAITEDCPAEIDCTVGAGGAHFHLGAQLSPRLALMWDFSTLIHSNDGFWFTYHSISTAALQVWLSQQFWLKGGLGFAWLQLVFDDGFISTTEGQSDIVPATLLAGGFEVLSAPNLSIDLQLRLSTGFYGDGGGAADGQVHNVYIGVGVNWFSTHY